MVKLQLYLTCPPQTQFFWTDFNFCRLPVVHVDCCIASIEISRRVLGLKRFQGQRRSRLFNEGFLFLKVSSSVYFEGEDFYFGRMRRQGSYDSYQGGPEGVGAIGFLATHPCRKSMKRNFNSKKLTQDCT